MCVGGEDIRGQVGTGKDDEEEKMRAGWRTTGRGQDREEEHKLETSVIKRRINDKKTE